MVDTGAQKRKAEDEIAALATDTLGEHDQPASKKIKSEAGETNSAPPETSEPAATDAGMTGTLNDIQNAAELKQEDVPNLKQENVLTFKQEDAPNLKQEDVPELKQEDVANSAASQDTKAEDASNHSTDMPQDDADAEPPQTIGYKSFKSGEEAFTYFSRLVHDLRNDQDLNEVVYRTHATLLRPQRDATV